VEQKLREKLEHAYKFHDEMQEEIARTSGKHSEKRERLRKKKA
jgi:hypothetical protein